ncbi:hypothetical protein U1Q18_028433 [Sarracenia purpurea var. burkii]
MKAMRGGERPRERERGRSGTERPRGKLERGGQRDETKKLRVRDRGEGVDGQEKSLSETARPVRPFGNSCVPLPAVGLLLFLSSWQINPQCFSSTGANGLSFGRCRAIVVSNGLSNVRLKHTGLKHTNAIVNVVEHSDRYQSNGGKRDRRKKLRVRGERPRGNVWKEREARSNREVESERQRLGCDVKRRTE